MSNVEILFLNGLLISAIFLLMSLAGSYFLKRSEPGQPLVAWGWSQQSWSKGTRLGLVIFLVISLIGSFLMFFMPAPEHPVQNLMDQVAAGNKQQSFYQIMLLVTAGAIIAPIGEEVFFRGLLLPVLVHRLGQPIGLLLSAVIFGAFHLDIYRFVPLTAAGWLLGRAVLQEKSLAAAIVGHAVWNACGLFLMLLYAMNRGAG